MKIAHLNPIESSFNKMVHYEKTIYTGELSTKYLTTVSKTANVTASSNLLEWKMDSVLYDIEPVFDEMEKISAKLKGSVPRALSTTERQPFNDWARKVARVADELFPDWDDAQKTEWLKARVVSFFELYNFYINGKRIFKLTESLVDVMGKTKGNYFLEYIKVPYNSIYITFPSGMFTYSSKVVKESLFSLPEKKVRKVIEGAYIRIVNKNSKTNMIDVWEGGDSKCLSIKFEVKSDYHQFVGYQNILIENGVTIDECVKQIKQQSDDSWKDNKCLETILKSLAYINSTNSDIIKINPPSNKKINEKKFKKFPNRVKSRLPYNLVGGDIRINNKPLSGGESTGTGKSLQTRFMVRGHYHHFWKIRTEEITNSMIIKINDDGKVLVRKWIAPYWKGPEYGDVILKNYKVTT